MNYLCLVPSTLGDYVNNILRAQRLETPGNETLYLFGDLDISIWSDLLAKYKKPAYNLPGNEGALSFGIAGELKAHGYDKFVSIALSLIKALALVFHFTFMGPDSEKLYMDGRLVIPKFHKC